MRKTLSNLDLYIATIKSDIDKSSIEEGQNRLQPEKLMTIVLNKYEILHKQNLWNVKSPEEEKVLALTGKVQKLSDANLKLLKFLDEKKTKKDKSNNNGTKEEKEEKWT